MSKPNPRTVPQHFRKFYGSQAGPTPERGEPFTPSWHRAELASAKARLWLINDGHYFGSPSAQENRGYRGEDPSLRDEALLKCQNEISWHLWALEVAA